MDKLKRKIIKYFIVCVFAVSLLESAWDSTCIDILYPLMENNKIISKIMPVGSIIGNFVIFFVFAFVFWHLINKIVNTESKRQVKERNMQYSRICHDLKTPMTSVQGFAAALRDGRIKPEEQKEIFDIIYNKSCYMNELVESMFAYSKLDTEEFQIISKRMDLCSFVRGIVALHYDEFEKRNMELQLDIPQEPIFCLLDEKEMKRSISNLIINAYKHNANRTKVMIQVNHHENDCYVIVADSGKAIKTEEESLIFEPFMSGDDARTSGNGNGLGLTISRIIIRKHGGDLFIRKNINGYTKGFVVQIPSETRLDKRIVNRRTSKSLHTT